MEDKLTPAMKQYFDLKSQVEDAILFFRMGDFYEMFGDDAQIAHKILGVSLTSRNKNAKDPIPLAGIPYHAKEKYLPKLVAAGYKVAIAEQVSDPKLKGIVRREIVNIVSPGTLHIEMDTQSHTTHYVVGVAGDSKFEKFGISILDMTTTVWKCGEVDSLEKLVNILFKYSPDELVLDKQLFGDNILKDVLDQKIPTHIFYFGIEKDYYSHLKKHFAVKNLEGFGIEKFPYAQAASSLLLSYVSTAQQNQLQFLDSIGYESYSQYLDMDAATIRSLDILYNFYTKSSKDGTLLGILDMTLTPMGSRFLKNSLLYPLQNVKEILQRQSFIQIFTQDIYLLDSISKYLKQISDIDVLLYRLALKKAQAKDLIALKHSLQALVNIDHILQTSSSIELKKFFIK